MFTWDASAGIRPRGCLPVRLPADYSLRNLSPACARWEEDSMETATLLGTYSYENDRSYSAGTFQDTDETAAIPLSLAGRGILGRVAGVAPNSEPQS